MQLVHIFLVLFNSQNFRFEIVYECNTKADSFILFVTKHAAFFRERKE